MDGFIKKINDFFNSHTAIIIFSIIGTIFAIVELISFFGLGMEINGVSFNEAKEDISLLILTLSLDGLALISLFLGFFVGIANTRGSIYATPLSIAIMVIMIILDAFAGLWLVALQLSISIPIVIYRKGFWAKEKYKNEKYLLKNKWPLILTIGLISVIFFFGIVILWGEQLYSFSLYPNQVGSNSQRSYVWYLDATVAAMGILGNVCLVFRWRIAYLWWTIAKIPLIICFAVNGNLVQISQQLIFFVIDMGTVLAMTYQQKLQKNEITIEVIK